MCANEQGRFWDYHDMLFANWNGENQGAFADARLVAFADTLGLDMDAFNSCFDAQKYQDQVLSDTADGQALGVQGTPTLFVNDQMGQDLYLGQAIPRYWLSKGNKVGIERAPSHFGALSFELDADASGDKIKAVVDPPERNSPKNIFVRLRHPKERQIKSVTVNGQPYEQFDAKKEWVILPGTVKGQQQIEVSY